MKLQYQSAKVFLHLLHVGLTCNCMVNDWMWVIDSNDTIGILLDIHRSLPRLVDVLGGKFGQSRDVIPNVVTIRVSLLAKRDWRVHSEILVEE